VNFDDFGLSLCDECGISAFSLTIETAKEIFSHQTFFIFHILTIKSNNNANVNGFLSTVSLSTMMLRKNYEEILIVVTTRAHTIHAN
jgi:uncharacterized protein YsxB (DUF464 family)